MTDVPDALLAELTAIRAALERLAPAAPPAPDWAAADAFVWQNATEQLGPVGQVNRIALALIQAVGPQRDLLLQNTWRFATGLAAHNVLLWGARGMGKSSLVKAVHHEVSSAPNQPLKLVEIHREDIEALPRLMALTRRAPANRFIIFCDDLSFDGDDTTYKSLKAALEGGIEGRPPNVLFYATSNRRHLMPRDMMENERSTAIAPSEAVEEKVSLSDRFGLWIGFHKCSQDDYLAIVGGYVRHFGLKIGDDELRADALEWSTTRGARSGRVAWQYIQDLAGRLGVGIVS
ncbi:ATP-DEPENDENT PROTEASE SUBUNIT [hydrothermal vent metagenome]|uniref:ATP-DEPENDENT PROTEASE SUBUNIT n=1 Tax=hydrothermal vent metagenome TaxID=652676 RepID=A0A3B0TAN8_9ZZZZ